MKVEPFEVEQWMDEYETTAKYNIAETCCASVSIKSLLELSSMPIDPLMLLDVDVKQDYGEIRGLKALRTNLAALYSAKASARLPFENVLITPGAIAANYLLSYALIQPGDHVICHYPTYQSLYSVPKSLGANVDLWVAKPEKQWAPDIEELKSMVKPNTKMIILKCVQPLPVVTALSLTSTSNPQNPTGAVLKRSLLEEVIKVAQEKDIIIMSDEVYRPIFHGIGPMDADFPPSILSMGYDKVVCTGSMSKAYSLAGVRVGWIASRAKDIIETCAAVRHYTTISVSKLDQQVAGFALSSMTLHSLLGRNIKLAKENLAVLEAFINQHSSFCEWVKPVAGTTAFVKFKRDGAPVDAVEFCKTLQEKTGVMLLPGTCFGPEFKGYVRIGYVPEASVMKEGFQELTKFMQSEYANIPTV